MRNSISHTLLLPSNYFINQRLFNIAQPVICNGKTIYELNLAQFVNAIDNIYPELYMPVARNGVVLNPRDESDEEE